MGTAPSPLTCPAHQKLQQELPQAGSIQCLQYLLLPQSSPPLLCPWFLPAAAQEELLAPYRAQGLLLSVPVAGLCDVGSADRQTCTLLKDKKNSRDSWDAMRQREEGDSPGATLSTASQDSFLLHFFPELHMASRMLIFPTFAQKQFHSSCEKLL